MYKRQSWFYYSLPLLYLALMDSTTLYHGSNCLYRTLVPPTMSLLGSILHTTVPLLSSTGLYYSRLWLCFVLLDSTALYHYSTCFYMALLLSTMALLGCTTHYHCSTWLYKSLLHSTMCLLGSTMLYRCSTLLYLTLLPVSYTHLTLPTKA